MILEVIIPDFFRSKDEVENDRRAAELVARLLGGKIKKRRMAEIAVGAGD